MAMISICMATRNGEKYIEAQLSSILNQISDTDEIIISDDSSSDLTVDKIKAFNDPRIHLLENNTFFNPIFNIENALRHASGEIIVLSDQDDIWLNNKISLIRRTLGTDPREIHLIVMNGIIIDEKENVLYRSIFDRMNSGKGICKNIYANTYMGCCMAFTRSLLNVALPFPQKIPMHDMWLGLLAELFGSVNFHGDLTIKYRRHGDTATTLQRHFQIGTQLKWRYHIVRCLAAKYSSIRFRGNRPS